MVLLYRSTAGLFSRRSTYVQRDCSPGEVVCYINKVKVEVHSHMRPSTHGHVRPKKYWFQNNLAFFIQCLLFVFSFNEIIIVTGRSDLSLLPVFLRSHVTMCTRSHMAVYLHFNFIYITHYFSPGEQSRCTSV